MTINITSGSSGWGNYVLYGTKEKPRDSEKVQFLEGDIALGDRLSQSNNYQESYYKIVLAFEGKPSDEVIKGAYEDFKKEFFVGFNRDEYHIDAVVHKDTDNYHIHCRVPKQNLLTDTHLQLFMDKIDRPRKELIQDYISLKYGFNIARETNREVFKEQSHEHINKWREEHNQKPFDFKTKQGQKEAETQINSYVSDLIKSDLISSQNDVKSTLEELGLKVERFGHDIKKDFSYVTVTNETGKLRIKGDIYNDKFYEYNREDRTAQIDNNRRIEPEREPNQERAERVRAELNKANEKRFKTVTKLFKHSRERAEREHSKTFEVGRVESLNSSKHIKHSHISSGNDIDNKSDKFAETSKHHKREDDRSNRRTISEISSKRIDLRPTKESILLQTKIKDNRNERLINEAIERIREQREASATALQRARTERELVQSRITGNHEELQSRTSKIATYYGKIREKVVNSINVVKEKFKDFDFDFDKLVNRVKSSREKAEAPESDSSSLKRIKEVQKPLQNNDLKSYFAEKLSSKFDEIDKKAVLEQAQEPVKKRSHSRSR